MEKSESVSARAFLEWLKGEHAKGICPGVAEAEEAMPGAAGVSEAMESLGMLEIFGEERRLEWLGR